MKSCSSSTIIMNHKSAVDLLRFNASAALSSSCLDGQLDFRSMLEECNLRRSPTPCLTTLRSSGFPSSGTKAQHLSLITSAKSISGSGFQLCFCRQPPRMTPPRSPRGKMWVASPSRCGARKNMFRIGFSGPSTRRIWPCSKFSICKLRMQRSSYSG